MVSKRFFKLLVILAVFILIVSALPVIAQGPPPDNDDAATQPEDTVITDTVETDPGDDAADEAADDGEGDQGQEGGDEGAADEDDDAAEGGDEGSEGDQSGDDGTTDDGAEGGDDADGTAGDDQGDGTTDDGGADQGGGDDTSEDDITDDLGGETGSEDDADTPDEAVEQTDDAVDEVVVEEPVVEETIEAEAGEIGASAIPGSWTTNIIAIQNLGSQDANIVLEVYSGTNTSPVQTINKTAFPGGGATILSADLANNGRFAGVLSSDTEVAVAALHLNTTAKLGDLSPGVNIPAQELFCPRILRNWAGFATKLHIQNVHPAAQNITVETIRFAPSISSATVTYNNVPANTSFTVDFGTDTAYNGFGTGNNAGGYARIEGADGNIAVVCDNIQDSGNVDLNVESMLLGIPTSQAGRQLILPRVSNEFFSQRTGVNVVNVGGAATNVVMTYTTSTGTQHVDGPRTLAIGAATNFSFNLIPAFPQGTFGSAVVGSTASDIVLSNGGNKISPWKGGGETPGVVAANATNNAAIPLALRSNSWRSTINVFVLFSGTTISSTWVKADADPNGVGNKVVSASQTTSSNNQAIFFADDANISSSGAVNTPWVVYVNANGPIIALLNLSNAGTATNVQMLGINY